MRYPDELGLWTHRTLMVEIETTESVVSLSAATLGGLSTPVTNVQARCERPEIVDVPAAGEVPWRMKVWNQGHARALRRWFYHFRRELRQDTSLLIRRVYRAGAQGLRGSVDRVVEVLPAREDVAAEAAAPMDDGSTHHPGDQSAEHDQGDPSPLSARRSAFASSPSARSLYQLVEALYHDGQLRAPAALLGEHAEIASDFTSGQRRLAATIISQARLLAEPVIVPERAEGATHLVERDRILYCAHAVYPYLSNGYAIRTRGLVRGMVAAGHDVIVAARPGFPWDTKVSKKPERSSSYELRVDGIEYVFSHGPSLREQAVDEYLEWAVDSYLQVIARTRPERVHAASNHLTALPALIAARLAGIPFTYEVRGFWEYGLLPGVEGLQERGELAGLLEDTVMTEADHVFVLTAEMAAELHHRGLAPERITVAPNGVDPDQFAPVYPVGDFLKRSGIDRTRTVIGYMGSMVAYEGLEDLVEACIRLSQERDDFQLVMAGDGPVRDRIQARLDEAPGLAASMLGRVSPNVIPQLMSAVDLIVIPRVSTKVTELVSPLKPFEALAAGVPVLTSDVAVLRSLSTDSESTELFRAGDVDALMEALRRLLDDPQRRRELGRRGRAWVRARRSWETLGDHIASAILQVVPPAVTQRRALSGVKVALIADTFTTSTFAEIFDVISLGRRTAIDELLRFSPDVLVVESAWHGNDDAWHRGVGHYSESESADLRRLLGECAARGIPTVFWNKEDPVHFRRFIDNARLFDLVLTADNRSIPKYIAHRKRAGQQVGSMPFFAQPTLHHPVVDGPLESAEPIMFAGSYYGDRYKKRSAVMDILLAAAAPHGLAIFDRQADDPTSPYRFPESVASSVRGGLDYDQMVKAYRRFPLHLNVNSVTASETMFSRRVFEIVSSGGALLSGPSDGLRHMLRGLVPTVGRMEHARRAIDSLLASPQMRNVHAWNARRFVRRAHTLEYRLASVLRRVGIPAVVQDPVYIKLVLSGNPSEAAWGSLVAQTVRPSAVYVRTHPGSHVAALLDAACIKLHVEGEGPSQAEGELVGSWDGGHLDRTVLEDLAFLVLDANLAGAWLDTSPVTSSATPLAQLADPPVAETPIVLVRRGRSEVDAGVATLEATSSSGLGTTLPWAVARRGLLRAAELTPLTGAVVDTPEVAVANASHRIVVAGHDLKFATPHIERLRDDGHEVRIDHWEGHTRHDEALSRELVDWADIVFCEWGLGNAVWYSKHVRENQRLVVRVHLQEVFTPYFSRMQLENVDKFVYVAPHVRDTAFHFQGVASREASVIPNIVTVPEKFDRDPQSRFTLGMVGVVPQRKRLDSALDLLVRLRSEDDRYTLRIKGREPHEYSWMQDRPDELAYYEEQRRRIDEDPLLTGAVFFDGFSSDRAELDAWFERTGIVLSVSDYESFHYTLADGAVRYAVPETLAWAGADALFPHEWIHADLASMAADILRLRDVVLWRDRAERARNYVVEKFESGTVLSALSAAITGKVDTARG